MKKEFGTGLFVGRFQPFHKGHLYALEYSAQRCKHLIVGVGSSNISGTEKNPLDADSRIKILKTAINETDSVKAGKISIVELPDFNDDDKWFGYIIKRIPSLDVVFSRSAEVLRIFRSRGIVTISPPWHQRQRLSASRIRKLIREDREWQDRVPTAVVKEISSRRRAIKQYG